MNGRFRHGKERLENGETRTEWSRKAIMLEG
jgi:hypothetical protein